MTHALSLDVAGVAASGKPFMVVKCQKNKYDSDKTKLTAMSQITQSILSAVRALPEGGLLSPREFLHIGSRAAVDQALTRLARGGQLLRVGRGAYAAPVQGRFGPRPPSTEALVQAIQDVSGETIVPTGAAEANALGLTTQVPTREVFFTSGRSRTLQLGSRSVEFKHGNRLQLLLGRRPAGMAIRALSWLGPDQGAAVMEGLRSKLPSAEWAAMSSVRAIMPSWMAKAVGALMTHG